MYLLMHIFAILEKNLGIKSDCFKNTNTYNKLKDEFELTVSRINIFFVCFQVFLKLSIFISSCLKFCPIL